MIAIVKTLLAVIPLGVPVAVGAPYQDPDAAASA
jgi:hypothetical protein